MRHEREGWREEETWGEQGEGGEGDKQDGGCKEMRVSECEKQNNEAGGGEEGMH